MLSTLTTPFQIYLQARPGGIFHAETTRGGDSNNILLRAYCLRFLYYPFPIFSVVVTLISI